VIQPVGVTPHSRRRSRRSLLARLRRAFVERDHLVLEAGKAGERLVAKVRLGIVALFGLIQLAPQEPKERLVGTTLTLVAFTFSLGIYLAVRRRFRPWMAVVSVVGDVTLVSAGLCAFFLLDRPLTAVNSRVVFEAYFVAIASSGLRYNWRLCTLASVLAVVEFGGLSAFADRHWALAVIAAEQPLYGFFSWSAQIGRLVMLAAAGLVATSVALRGRRWRTLSGTDALTGVANRTWFLERLEEEASRARRRREPLAVAVADLDGFRTVNTTHLHSGGDLALQAVARMLRQSIRKSDLIARFGGDEFVLAFPGSDVAQAVARLDALREQVAAHELALPRGAARVTVSIGVASWPSDGDTFREVIALADARMYEAKRLGRNRVVGPASAPASAHG
jgi:two-component system, cell cycle response regulator